MNVNIDSGTTLIDYAKFLFVVDYDRAQEIQHQLANIYASYRDKYGSQGGWHMVPFGATLSEGKRKYAFEVWGPVSMATVLVSWTNYRGNLKRLDAKQATGFTDEEVNRMFASLSAAEKTHRNVNLFFTKPRTKRGGVSAGGKGFALGSHKSDKRVTLYRRPQSPYYLEVQYSGAKLKRLVEEVHEKNIKGECRISPWFDLADAIWAIGDHELATVIDQTPLL